MHLLVHPDVPNGHFPVLAPGDHISPFAVDGERGDGAVVGEDSYERGLHIRGPEGDGAFTAAEVDDGVVFVLGHGGGGPEAGGDFGDVLSGGDVVVFEVA